MRVFECKFSTPRKNDLPSEREWRKSCRLRMDSRRGRDSSRNGGGPREFHQKALGYSENPVGWSVRLNSPGGDLAGGIRLGELIRKLKLDTEIGVTEPDSYGHWKTAPGLCASACAFAFLGGLSRRASGGELGVHQFYNEISPQRSLRKGF